MKMSEVYRKNFIWGKYFENWNTSKFNPKAEHLNLKYSEWWQDNLCCWNLGHGRVDNNQVAVHLLAEKNVNHFYNKNTIGDGGSTAL